MTGKGVGAIAAVEVVGVGARGLLRRIFKPRGARRVEFEAGRILVGTIVDGQRVIDQVTIGCEGRDRFAINCHGNPLIVEMIMELLGRCGAELLSSEELLTRMLCADESLNTIAVEAELARLDAKTLAGTKIIAGQVEGGLGAKASEWIGKASAISIEQIAREAEEILENSERARLIIAGCTVVLAGPPNSGKSTLLNYLAGRQKAIVTDIEGTTRDWVSAQCRMEPLCVTVIDTAGLDEKWLDEKLAAIPENTVEKAAQAKTAGILSEADLILLVLDNSRSADQLNETLLEKIAGRKVLAVLNKSDLPARFDAGKLPKSLCETVQISAESGAGIETLKERILQMTGVSDFDGKTAVAFTGRQETLLKQLTTAKSRQQAGAIISKLLNAPVRV